MHAITTRIDSVTVYRSGALVRRIGELTPGAEGRYPETVRIGDLPLCLDDSSLRLRLEPLSDADVPTAADLRVALELPEVDEALPAVDDEALERARVVESEAKALVGLLESELKQLAAVALAPRPEGPEGEPPGESPLEARLAFIAFRAARERALQTQLSEAKLALSEATRNARREQDRYDRASSQRQAQSDELCKAAIVGLRSPGATGGSALVVVDYIVPGACWAPSYVLRLDPGLSAARLVLRALVAQRTGEDWKGVQVTLSTAAPQAWTELPELASRRIGRRQPMPFKRGWRPAPEGADALFADWDRAFRVRSVPTDAPLFDEQALEEAPLEADAEPEPTRRPQAARMEQPVRGGFVPPPQPVGGAPMPTMMPPPELASAKRSKSAGPIRALAAAAAAPAMLAAQGVTALMASGGGETGEYPATAAFQPPASRPPTQPGDLLRYGNLRLAPATSPDRGRLVITTQQQVFLQMLVDQRVTVAFDLDDLVRRSQRSARAGLSDLPARHRLAWSERYDYAYAADAPVDLASDGVFHGIPLTECDAGVAPHFVVVPRESTDVFRVVSIDNPLATPLLPGPADVYLAGRFLLTTDLDLTAPEGRIELGLGVEQGLKVARNTHFREESGGFMGKQIVLHHTIEVTLRNNLERSARIEVRERLPVTREGEDEIDVEEIQAAPAWEDYEPEPAEASEPTLLGGRRWTVTLPAAGERQLTAEYAVKLSAKNELVGGNRREG